MIQNVVIAGAEDKLAHRLEADFKKAGLTVFTCYGETADISEPIDLLIVNTPACVADAKTAEGFTDTAAALDTYRRLAMKPLRLINVFLPLLERGEGKRIGLITARESSINLCEESEGFGGRMALAALNMAATQIYNYLRPRGYTFRMYCRNPYGENDAWAADYFTRARSYEPHDLKHSDEERIVLRDWRARELPW